MPHPRLAILRLQAHPDPCLTIDDWFVVLFLVLTVAD
ncbi:hypothetical protein CCACVL1_03778 [Corchorus capsularis]|uniref:Uncharacterized protein n=1 Tax=Corchorus capsularis TaxID=210143 RepID=A0A1R3JXF5_COCAP|nr:hypothetical protein CCACVL1_03778 [Corchorus capsularis]